MDDITLTYRLWILASEREHLFVTKKHNILLTAIGLIIFFVSITAKLQHYGILVCSQF